MFCSLAHPRELRSRCDDRLRHSRGNVHRVAARECCRGASSRRSGAGTADAALTGMITKKKMSMNRVLEGVIAALPAIPYIMKPRRRTSLATYVLGGVGLALAGGIAAVMFFSPR